MAAHAGLGLRSMLAAQAAGLEWIPVRRDAARQAERRPTPQLSDPATAIAGLCRPALEKLQGGARRA